MIKTVLPNGVPPNLRHYLSAEKKALRPAVESPLTLLDCIDIFTILECAERPSGFPARHPDPPKSCAWLFLFVLRQITVFSQNSFFIFQSFLILDFLIRWPN